MRVYRGMRQLQQTSIEIRFQNSNVNDPTAFNAPPHVACANKPATYHTNMMCSYQDWMIYEKNGANDEDADDTRGCFMGKESTEGELGT